MMDLQMAIENALVQKCSSAAQRFGSDRSYRRTYIHRYDVHRYVISYWDR